MTIFIINHYDKVKEILHHHTSVLENKIFFDITYDSQSKIMISEYENTFTLGYSRPIFINFLKPPLSDFEFKFVIDETNSPDTILVKGNVKIKKYVIGLLLFIILVILFNIFSLTSIGLPPNRFFSIVMPIILFTLLILEYFFFVKRIRKFFQSLNRS